MDAAFFNAVRASLFDGKLSQRQVDVFAAIFLAWAAYGDGDRRKLAYLLATAYHESGRFRWLREIWGPTAAQKRYEGREDLGNTLRGDGKKFMGRGLVHITGRRNYADWSRRLGLDLVNDPQLAERLDVAARILVQGCMLGTFTGKSLGDYIDSHAADYIGARRVVNGTDKAKLIAGYAVKFEQALAAGGQATQPAEAPAKPTPPLPTPEKPASAPQPQPTRKSGGIGIAAVILAGLAALFAAIWPHIERMFQ